MEERQRKITSKRLSILVLNHKIIVKNAFFFYLNDYTWWFPHRDGADLIENNLVTRVSAQKNFTICEKKFPSLMDNSLLKSLIMAQIERWRQASYMQVERESIFGCE